MDDWTRRWALSGTSGDYHALSCKEEKAVNENCWVLLENKKDINLLIYLHGSCWVCVLIIIVNENCWVCVSSHFVAVVGL